MLISIGFYNIGLRFRTYLRLIEAAEQEQDGGADALQGALVASEGGQKINEPVARQELPETHGSEDPLRNQFVG